MQELSIAGYLFTFAGIARLEKDDLYPELRYAKRSHVPLLPHGAGPYCRFAVPGLPPESGVYAMFVAGRLQYVGQAVNIRVRFQHYGRISPKNCYVGGRSTNVRINKLVRDQLRMGAVLEIYIYATKDYDAVESRLIAEYRPPWNRRGIAARTS